MQLTNKQEEGLKIAVDRYNIGMPYTCISGYAGSGKSTLVKFIVSALDIDPEDVAYVAYTGKAANVLKNKGCPNATTAHKLLYYANKDKNGIFHFKPRPRLEHDYKLIVVDEVSMLPDEIWYQLLTHGVYVLAMGDPGQLPPVKGQAAPILDNPHVFLDEIMRQAQESAIIRLSMHIREGKDFRQFPTVSGEVRIIPHKFQFVDENTALLQANQVICGTNAERNRLNNKIRALQGRGSEPEIGDKIICLDNHWEEISVEGNALTNGAIGTTPGYTLVMQDYPATNKLYKDFQPTQLMMSSFNTDDGDTFIRELPIDYKCLVTGEPSLTPKQEAIIAHNQKMLINKMMNDPYFTDIHRFWKELPYHFNYGYAITCWKAQGSEYQYVLGYEANWLKQRDPEQYKKYLYTLVTRASQAIILVGD